MIRYHGGPITPDRAAIETWRDGHAMISFANQQQIALAFEYAGEVALDNGAFSLWGKGERLDVDAYTRFIELWRKHPAFGWCVIPDIIDGTEEENTKLIQEWPHQNYISVPVWHLHESLDKLGWLCDDFPRVAIGSSGEYSEIGTPLWKNRMAEAMAVSCDSDGYPLTRLHGLRQMDNDVTSNVPYGSVDSCNIARNIGIDSKWRGPYAPESKELRALIMRDRIANHAACRRWSGCWGRNMELFG
jgi:hypothetical protein